MVDSLGGYRLLRTVGVGPRAEVILAHPLRSDADPTPVVIKVYGEAVSEESVLAEIEALSRAAGDHVVRLIDVTSTPRGAPALILARHAAASLARLLGERQGLTAGEAITVLAPLAAALARMHSAGVAHGGIAPGAVLFDAGGSPTLGCFGRATLFAPGLPPAGLETEQGVLADVLAYGSLAAGVLEGAGAAQLAHRARTQLAPGARLIAFADELFDLGEPLPVDLRSRPQPDPVTLPARVIAAAPVLAGQLDEDEPAPAWRQRLERLRDALGRVRRPVWVTAGASLAALLLALLLVPESGGALTADPPAVGLSPSSTAVPPTVVDEAVGGDDPVAATAVLLAAREECIRELSAECLDGIDQQGSAALAADRELVAAIAEGGGPSSVPRVEAGGVALVQRLGDSALVSLGADSEPASVLLVKGEAGWRIRDYLEG